MSLPEPPRRHNPDRAALGIALRLAALAVFAWLAIELVRPFTDLALWTAVIAAALHPAYRRLAARLGGRRWLAAALVTLMALVVTLGPIATLAADLVESGARLAMRARTGEIALPGPPPALAEAPLVGPSLASNWRLATENFEEFVRSHDHILIGAGERALLPALRFAEGMAILVAAVALSGFLHPFGDRLAPALRRAARALAGPRGSAYVDLSAATIRNVARGVIGVAVLQAILIGIGLMAGDVPGAGILTLAALALAIVQIGAWPLVLAILAWLWFGRAEPPSLLLTGYLALAAVIDTPLKPLMLSGGAQTPRLAILAGVVAGVVAYGLIGLFLGPILLAVAYEAARHALATEEGRDGPA